MNNHTYIVTCVRLIERSKDEYNELVDYKGELDADEIFDEPEVKITSNPDGVKGIIKAMFESNTPNGMLYDTEAHLAKLDLNANLIFYFADGNMMITVNKFKGHL